MKKMSMPRNTIIDSVLGGGKHGFTLAELLIVLGIIGIISAILLPNILKSKPDENKAMCVTSYNALKTSLRHIIQEHGNFPGGKQESAPDENHIIHRYDYDKAPLATLTEGREKSLICTRIATYMDIENSSCTDDFVGQDQVMNGDYFKDHKSFSKNGIDWFITTNRVPDNNTPSEYRTDVYIDVNGENGDNCLYNADTCKTPDRFKFTILANGRVVPADAVSNEYIRTQHSWFKNNGANFDDFNDNIIAGITQIPGEQVCEKCYVKNGDICELDLTNPECQEPLPNIITIQYTYTKTSEFDPIVKDGIKEESDPCEKYPNHPYTAMSTSDGHCVAIQDAGMAIWEWQSICGNRPYWIDGSCASQTKYLEIMNSGKNMQMEEHEIAGVYNDEYTITATVISGTVNNPITIKYASNECTINSSTNSCSITLAVMPNKNNITATLQSNNNLTKIKQDFSKWDN